MGVAGGARFWGRRGANPPGGATPALRSTTRCDSHYQVDSRRLARRLVPWAARVGPCIGGVATVRTGGRVAVLVAKFLGERVDEHLLVVARHLPQLHDDLDATTVVEHLDGPRHD